MCIVCIASLTCNYRHYITSLGIPRGEFFIAEDTMHNTGTQIVTEVDAPVKKYIRTTLKLEDGTYVSARINTETGEIKPYNYAKKPKLFSAKPEQDAVERVIERAVDHGAKGNLLGYEPSWLHDSWTKRDIAETTADGVKPRSWKSLANPNCTILAEFLTVQDACADYPWLEDILVGATHLDCGNTRPFSMKQFFFMLRDLNEINVETIYAYTTCGEKHCYRLAQHTRVLVNAFNRECNR